MTDKPKDELDLYAELDAMASSGHYDREGKPIKLGTWCRLGNYEDYRRVAADIVGPLYVSTIWMGIDYSFGFGGPPLHGSLEWMKTIKPIGWTSVPMPGFPFRYARICGTPWSMTRCLTFDWAA